MMLSGICAAGPKEIDAEHVATDHVVALGLQSGEYFSAGRSTCARISPQRWGSNSLKVFLKKVLIA